ncbi:NAD(+) synthase [Marseilla massiliensis]|jgi:NAD+ synthase (glutamine-hydrolysing)|uniref:Glutamine-dependent NAD(+) synthetase n=1 Tax=Marseilla massiliensis TaxID=1841864 RepID=A0A938WU40_9BACT|nr:NAD(+) synthase [Marseilla massiliensis]MBM6673746.1 NAD(+) synthase [Marseilla massiliensis]
MENGFIKVASAVPSVKVADCEYNVQQIENIIAQAEGKGVEVIVFPELSITGYTCQDLFRQSLLLEQAETSVLMLLDFTRNLDIVCIVGLPVVVGDVLLNCAAVIQKGDLLGLVPKTYLPNYSEFYEKRWFASSQDLQPTEIRFAGNTVLVTPQPTLFRTCDGVLFGIEICEDVWAPAPPSNVLALAGADIIFNLSASDELIGKHAYLKSLLSQQSARTISGYVYSGCGFGESSQDMVYAGNSLVYENGHLIAEGERFSLAPQTVINQIDVEKLRSERRTNSTYVNAQRGHSARIVNVHGVSMRDFELLRDVEPHPFIPKTADMEQSCDEIFSIQVAGLAKRLVHTGCKTVVLGISGGLDSTLALLVCVKTFDKLGRDRKGIVGVTMPGFGTTDRTHSNAVDLMHALGVTSMEISISDSVRQHFKDIGQDMAVHDVTYENSQARERTQILMDLSNKLGGMVVGTGDLSELALGWATYNGDHMSMYGVNAGIPKTLIKYLVEFVASKVDESSRSTLYDILDTPVSPELIPADENGNISQKTEELVGPYELHDFFLYNILRFGFRPRKIFMLARRAFDGSHEGASFYDDDTIKKWLKTFLRRFFAQQFKRSCLPDGPKVGSVSLSPRGDWRMPSDASASLWLKECEQL